MTLIALPSERLLERREITPGGCWEWTGTRRNGYGRVSVNGRLHSVHRVAASLWIEGFELDSPLVICHRCDNPPCFNPEHLFPGTASDNMSDAAAKGRLSGPRPKATIYPRLRSCETCGTTYRPHSSHRGRSIVCSAQCLAVWRSFHNKSKTADTTNSMRAFVEAGWTYRDVADLFGVTASSVHRRINGRKKASA